MKTVVLATNNAHKVSEIKSALNFEGWEFKTLAEMGVVSDPEEDADSFEGNARIKALSAWNACPGCAALADDSGLEVDALDGAPGVYSARYAGVEGEGADAANNALLLEQLLGVPDDQRSARFVCTLVFIDEDGTETVARGTIEGRIGHAEKGSEGFGYDPLFLPDEFQGRLTLAEVDQAAKNAISHRGNALRALKQKLQEKAPDTQDVREVAAACAATEDTKAALGAGAVNEPATVAVSANGSSATAPENTESEKASALSGISVEWIDEATMALAFPSADGKSKVSGRLWLPVGEALESPRGIVQLIHGMAEHIDRYEPFARYLCERGYVVCGHDHVGHGRTAASQDDLGEMPVHGGVDVLIADAYSLRLQVQEAFSPELPYIIFGHSMGSLVLRCYLALHGEGLAAAIICGTPMPPRAMSGAGNVLARAVALANGAEYRSDLLHALADGAYSSAIPDARTPFDWLSRDPAVADGFAADERTGFMFSAGAYATLTDAAYRAAAPATFEQTPRSLPLLVVAGAEDPVGDRGAGPARVAESYGRAGVEEVDLTLYGGMRHEILNEIGKERVWSNLAAWIERHS